MPELPEVETVVRGLKRFEGQTLQSICVHDPRVWFESDFSWKKLQNQKLLEVSRRGKYLIFRFPSGVALVQHLRMTGKMLSPHSTVIPEKIRATLGKKNISPQIRCTFAFAEEKIVFFDARRFGTLSAVENEAEFFGQKSLAPDPILAEQEALAVFLAKQKIAERPWKAALLDQSLVAGVGNIYADEALFLSGIHPLKKASRTKDPMPLWKNILALLQRSIEVGGTSIVNYVNAEGERGKFSTHLQVYGRTGEPCYQCGDKIRKIQVVGRSTHFCPSCQKK